MKLLTTFNQIPWKAVVGINFMFLILGGVGLATKYAQQPTSTSSKAAPAPTEIPAPNYPNEAPVITAIELPFAKPGDAIRIHGKNFGDYQWGSTITPNVNVIAWSDSTIDITLPTTIAPQVLALTLTVNNRSAATRVAVYDLLIDPELVLEQIDDTYYLVIHHFPNNGQLTFMVNGTKQQIGYTNSDQVVYTSKTPPQLDLNSISITQNGKPIPYFIDPLSPLLQNN